ncbi:MAG TPA: antitoxin Xre-like helix-turn-helix domain-containing protein [Vicinamibacterales bacterium]|nr:antitoxin Xre-like helix-turn-helix domain-containing protein [Vicinamibacterales bacterium]
MSSGDSRKTISRPPGPQGRKRLGELLVASEAITTEQLDQALTAQKTSKLPLGQALLKLGFVTDEVMRRALGTQLGIPYLDLDNVVVDRALSRSVPQEFATEHLVLPIAQFGPTLTVAMDDPTAGNVVDELGQLTGSSIIVVTSSALAIRKALRRLYDDAATRGTAALASRLTRNRGESDAGAAGDIAHFRSMLGHPETTRLAYAALVGLRPASFQALNQSLEEGLPYETLERLVINSGLPEDRVLEMVSIPRGGVLRRKQEGRLSSEESDRLLRAAYICGLALELFRDDRGLAAAWLMSRQPSLEGAKPATLAQTSLGAREVEATIRRLLAASAQRF